MSDWFVTHKEGFRQIHERLVERRGFGLIGYELYQNVRDTEATVCNFSIKKVEGKPRAIITCEDNGPGFRRLSDAWTMFAPSEKKHNPELAGRFNIGEKVVLSFAYEATIHTTSGTVVFDSKGRQEYPRRKRENGTLFQAELACTAERYEQILAAMNMIIVKPELQLFVNDEEIAHREPIHMFETMLRTEIGDTLRPTVRRARVELYPVSADEVPTLYELGIPVVETGDKYHVSVCQKVPLNSERDNVTPAYLQAIRVATFNEMHRLITPDDVDADWVNQAASDDDCSDDAAETFRLRKYGEKSVVSDPTNPEADAEAVSHGYVLIPSRGLTPGQRNNLYRAGTLRTSSKEFPSAGKGAYSDDPNAKPVKVLDESYLTDGMRHIRDYTVELGRRLLGKKVVVRFVHTTNPFGGCYGRGHLEKGHFDYNVFRLGKDWFAHGVTEKVDDLIIHEFGHDFESNHLCEGYYSALTMLGAKLKAEVLRDFEWFRQQSKITDTK